MNLLEPVGACANVRVDSPEGRSLFKSELIVGSDQTFTTGRLPLDNLAQPGRLILQVDPASREGPAGADPLDIRDIFDWIEPIVELDPAKVEAEILRRSPRLIAAWQNWRVTSGNAAAVRLVTWRDAETPPGTAYRLLASSAGGPLTVSGKLLPRPYKDQLLLFVSRPPQVPPSTLEVRLEGQPMGPFDVPVRSGAEARPLVISLAAHHGRTIAVELVQRGSQDKALVEWRAISLVGRTAVP